MSNPFAIAVKQRLASSGGAVAVSLLEVLTIAGQRFYWADQAITAPTALATLNSFVAIGEPPNINPMLIYPPATFVAWLTGAGPFALYDTTQTSTGQVTVQNLSGDTVRRDISQIFSRQAMTGALVFFRSWLADCEFATFSFMGKVDEAEIEADGESMTLTLESLCCWSKIDAPDAQICPSCQLVFGSIACGSTSLVPCNNDYGTCSTIGLSTERFKGFLNEWIGSEVSTAQYVQPEPLRLVNARGAN